MSCRTAILVLVLILCTASAKARELNGSFQAQADTYLRDLAAKGRFRGSVLVWSKGKILFEKGYGNAVEAWSIPNTPATKFELASLTKQFTGAAILLLAQSAKLNVDDPVSKYFAGAPDSWNEISVDQLVTHTSGLPNNELKDFPKGICVPYGIEELIATFKDRPLKFKPGTDWSYTNTEYYLLAYIIEKVSGKSYSEFLTENIFKPLGMKDSGFASTLAIVPQIAEGYAREGNGLRHRDYYDRSLEVGAGGAISTAEDMLRWNQALYSEQLLSRKSLELMFAPSRPGNYGYGWFIQSTPRLKEFHEGSDPGFAAFEARYPKDRGFIIVLSNLEDAPVRDMANDLGALLFDGKLPANGKIPANQNKP
jgi:CubicO group peptidase (beta-lactamase class C family)